MHFTNHVYLNSSAVCRALPGKLRRTGPINYSGGKKNPRLGGSFGPAGGSRREEVRNLAPSLRPPSPLCLPLTPGLRGPEEPELLGRGGRAFVDQRRQAIGGGPQEVSAPRRTHRRGPSCKRLSSSLQLSPALSRSGVPLSGRYPHFFPLLLGRARMGPRGCSHSESFEEFRFRLGAPHPHSGFRLPRGRAGLARSWARRKNPDCKVGRRGSW